MGTAGLAGFAVWTQHGFQNSKTGSPTPVAEISDIFSRGPPSPPRGLLRRPGFPGRLRGWLPEVSAAGCLPTHEGQERLEKSPVAFAGIATLQPAGSVQPGRTVRNVLIAAGASMGGGMAAVAGMGVAVAQK